ncbi:Protein vprbp [Fasciola hepatica]|uniref:Protein vprbp n=1 Tax=Fasciola hepatica TaxID=6192 RepID=A0A4E0RHB6_FASHE|nr:Protein vprbp [Fasciola hepatica]
MGSLTANREVIEEKKLERKTKHYAKVFYGSRWGIWMDFAETTTLHGPIHITATRGKLRIYYAIVVSFMSTMFIAHAAYLFLQYLSFPVLTEIKYGNIDFTYPDVTICPNSPFTDADFPMDPRLMSSLNSSEKFWTEKKGSTSGSPRLHQKRSMLSVFYRWSSVVGKNPHQYVLECQVNKVECLDDFIITEHPTYYRCFTLRVRTKPPVPAGPTNGIRLILHRGRVLARPLLSVVEEEPAKLQSVDTWDTPFQKDGFFIAFHEQDTFPSFPVQSLPNGLTLRFGQTTRIALEQTHYEAVNLTGRVCANGNHAPQIELLRLDKDSQSNADQTEGMLYGLLDFDIILFAIISSEKPQTTGDGLPGCPLRCKRRMISVHSSLQTTLVQNIDPKTLISYFEMLHLKHLTGPKDSFIKHGGPLIHSKDLIFLDIHPVSEMVNQIIENPGYVMTRFLSDLGGISGLYVGITIYTIAEIVDVVTQFLCVYLPYVWSAAKLEVKKRRFVTRLAKRLTSDDTETEMMESHTEQTSAKSIS